MRLTVIGSGTLLPDDHHRSPSHWVEEGELRLLLDCGSGTVHGLARDRLSWKAVTHVALTHFHTDHVGDLAPLLFALRHGVRPPRAEPLVILGPVGLEAHLDALARAHGGFVLDPGFPLKTVELAGEAVWEDPEGRFRLRTHPTPHTDTSLAFRIETGEGALGYTGDTGPDSGLASFFAGVQVLLSECSVPDPPEIATHLSPVRVAEIARVARPDLLVLTHLFPPLRPHRLRDQLRKAGYDGEILVANDGTVVEIESAGARLAEG